MARQRKREHNDELDQLVQGRAPVQRNQTGSGKHRDRRTKRNRDRSTKERNAVQEGHEEA